MARKTAVKSEKEMFVEEYLVDFDFYAAAIRAGVPRLQARKKGKLLMQDGDVLRLVKERLDTMLPEEIVSPQRILGGLMREAGTAVFNSDRVAALKAAHSVLKDLKVAKRIDREDEEKDKIKKRGSGVMVVPGVAALNDWEAAAQAQQAKLKEKVKE